MHTLILFDFDGVLADSFDLFSWAFLEACRTHGVQGIRSRKDFLDLFDGNLYEEMERRGVGGSLQKDILKEMAESLAHRSSEIRLFKGIPDTVTALARDAVLYVITSNLGEIVSRVLQNGGVTGIKEIWGAEKETSKVRKIHRLRERHPECPPFYIGDTSGDIREARKAGVGALAVTWGWHDRERLLRAGPDALFNSPAELAAFFTQPGDVHDTKTERNAC